MKWTLLPVVIAGGALMMATGCAVPQPRGEGAYSFVTEPSTKAQYHLYLPVDYVRNNGKHPNPKIKGWPLVMTFHGMKPYDNAKSQEREWEKEADIYGYIVCAPELNTSDSFMEYPLTKEHDYVLKDRANVIAIMEDIFQKQNADRKRVLSTSWSCGGYLAHYFQNRYPDRFSCLATRLSNFSPSLMNEDTIPVYKDRVPVAIFIGDGDFPACKSESEEAVAWYEAHDFRTVRGKMIDNIGHARIPQTCAAFFAEQLGIEPLHPLDAARTVAQVKMTEYYPPQGMIARYSPKGAATPTALASAAKPRKETASYATPPARAGEYPPSKPSSAGTYSSAGAGRNYPDRTPLYEQSGTKQGQVGQTPPVNHSATTPTMTPKTIEPAGGTKSTASDRTANPSSRTNSPRNDDRGARQTGSRTNPAASPRNDSSPNSTSPVTPWKPHEPAGNPSVISHSTGQQAQTGQSTRPPMSGDHPSPSSARKPYGVSPAVGGLPGSSGRSNNNSPASASRSFTQQGRVDRVSIRFSGPAVGTSPHFLEYSVDLPKSKVDGADFLWMDNGVWMGNEPTGKKILQSPGLHQISVLIVTKDDVEYRGAATVQVLEPGPGGGAY